MMIEISRPTYDNDYYSYTRNIQKNAPLIITIIIIIIIIIIISINMFCME